MLELKKITKQYKLTDFNQTALDKVSLCFRDNEFVSILGPSGSGKTTMLNIIGGLDTYSSGDLIINGVSTKNYKDNDWDRYRNHNVGFVFQSYNLIGHQTILANVELALTISGVTSKIRRKKAIQMLKKVGLGDHINKKPNQLSGGQMQRVAIARALINDPDILLADEPTGALDSETSVQIMKLLKDIAKDKLVIMVTHNPELAEEYSTRIVKVLDGNILDDSNPYDGVLDNKHEEKKSKKNFMNFRTALQLSFNNLLTKKGRTLMTSFAGSIGIIGIALILSLSTGVQKYIKSVEEDTLSSYPIVIEESAMNIESLMGTMSTDKKDNKSKDGVVYSNDMIVDMMSTMTAQMMNNNLREFKSFIDSDGKDIDKYLNSVSYSYNLNLQLYKNTTDEVIKVNPNPLMEDKPGMGMGMPMTSNNVFIEMLNNKDLLEEQYDLKAGKWADKHNEVMILLDDNGQISDFTLYTLGIKDQHEYFDMMEKLMAGEVVDKVKQSSYTYEELLDLSYKLVLNSDYYKKENNIWKDMSNDTDYMKSVLENALEIKVVGIVQPSKDSNINSGTGAIFYTDDLTKYVVDEGNKSEIGKNQIDNPDINIFTGMKFSDRGDEFNMNDLSAEEKTYLSTLSQEEMANLMASYSENAGATYEDILIKLGVIDLENPSIINLYPKDFESKEEIESIISEYNSDQTKNDKEENVINYNDYIGIMLNSVTVIIDMISYVLIAFVSISLVVSSIMIGIITYISVLERTKEIGILRAIGASKKDISRVFNAETFIVGLFSGTLGILVTLLLNLVVNSIVYSLTDVNNIASLPINGAIILVLISITLTLIAGLIPSKMASKKNPVEALRTE